MALTSHTLSTSYGTYRIHKCESDPSLPWIVYLHGGPGFSSGPEREWLTPIFRDRLNCLWFDQLGSHQSPAHTSESITWDHLVSDTARILTENFGHPVNLLCHSFGAHIAHELVKVAPERISRAVFVSPSHSIVSRMKRTLRLADAREPQALTADEKERLIELAAIPDERFGLEQTLIFRELFFKFKDIWKLYWRNDSASERYQALAASYPLSLDAFIKIHTAALTRSFDYSAYRSIPTLILQGDADPITTLEEDASRLATALKGQSPTLIPSTSHWPHLESPETVLSHLEAFLKTQADFSS